MKAPRDISLDGTPPAVGFDISAFFGATSISFVVADPSRPDCPIVYVNRAFELTTGYSHRYVIGRNCRFLQGPDTDRDAVRNIAIAVSRGEAVRQTLLNYRADGSSFVNDLVITPIKDADGDVAYFVGVQREIDESAAERDEALRRRTVDIVRQQVQLHLSVVMEISRMHIDEDGKARANEGAPEPDFFNLLRRLEILDLLYENLNESVLEDELLDVGAYVSQIAAKLVARSPRPGVRINISTESVVVPLDIAVRVGVILAELMDASLTQSFDGTGGGQLDVSLKQIESVNGSSAVLSIYDDGDGTTEARDWLSSGDLTLKMIRRLLKDVGATIRAPRVEEGREVEVTIPIKPVASQR